MGSAGFLRGRRLAAVIVSFSLCAVIAIGFAAVSAARTPAHAVRQVRRAETVTPATTKAVNATTANAKPSTVHAHITGTATARSFVSASGTDSGTCTVTAPCRTFTYALEETLAGGEIVVLTSGSYAPVTVDQSVLIEAAPGVYAGITVPKAEDGITVTAPTGDTVELRDLVIRGASGSYSGIYADGGAALRVESSNISGLGSDGIYDPNEPLTVINTATSDNGYFGIFADGQNATESTRAPVAVIDCQLLDNKQYGLYALDGVIASVSNTVISGNGYAGVYVSTDPSDSSDAAVDVTDSQITQNTGAGLLSSDDGAPGRITVGGSLISQNATGVAGAVFSNKTNELEDNTTNGTFSGSTPLS